MSNESTYNICESCNKKHFILLRDSEKWICLKCYDEKNNIIKSEEEINKGGEI